MTFSHPTYGIIRSLLAEAFSPRDTLSILDFGCGSGALLDHLPPECVGAYLGVDVNRESIQSASAGRAGGEIHFRWIEGVDGLSAIEAEQFDAVILIGVLQYLGREEVGVFFSEASRILKRGGIILGSCTSDHVLYRAMNLYRWISPHAFIDRSDLVSRLHHAGFETDVIRERGLLFSPLVANVGVVLFDGLDKVVFRTRGTLGPMGRAARALTNLIVNFEFRIPADYGYTLYFRARKVARASGPTA